MSRLDEVCMFSVHDMVKLIRTNATGEVKSRRVEEQMINGKLTENTYYSVLLDGATYANTFKESELTHYLSPIQEVAVNDAIINSQLGHGKRGTYMIEELSKQSIELAKKVVK